MKKMLIVLLSLLLTLPALGEAPAPEGFMRYDNLVYRYGFSLPDSFVLTDEYSDSTGAETVYDGRDWRSPDSRFTFFFQLKQPTYRSLDEEIRHYGSYLDLVRPGIEASGGKNLRFASGEVTVHGLPAGRMLENATLFESASPQGGTLSFCSVYLDYYDDNNEYIFGLLGRGASYEETRALLLAIGATVTIAPVLIKQD